ncbi:hypothetical protein N8Z08_02075 [bacterium]|nr:hypothetical protein [bacterium]
MGVNKNKHTGGIYYNIVNGEVARRFREHQFDSQKNQTTVDREITDDKGNVTKIVIEEQYESIDGIIVAAEINNEGNFGSVIRFTLADTDTGEQSIFSMPLDSSYGRSVLLRIPNIDPTKKVTFRPYSFESKDQVDKNNNPKKIVGVTVYQKDCGWDKSNVPAKWTKDNPGSLPQWEKKIVAGKEKWNSDDQLNFLAQHFMQWANKIDGIVPEVKEAPKPQGVQMDATPLEMEREFAERNAAVADLAESINADIQPENENEVDDLPF